MNRAVLSLLLLAVACGGQATSGSSQKQPSPGAGGTAGGKDAGNTSQKDASTSPSGPIQAVCVRDPSIDYCTQASYPVGYVCTDVGADGGATPPDGGPVLSQDAMLAKCTSAGVSGYPGQTVICCTDLGPEFAN